MEWNTDPGELYPGRVNLDPSRQQEMKDLRNKVRHTCGWSEPDGRSKCLQTKGGEIADAYNLHAYALGMRSANWPPYGSDAAKCSCFTQPPASPTSALLLIPFRAFGGIVAFNRAVDVILAQDIRELRCYRGRVEGLMEKKLAGLAAAQQRAE
ncbi:hypothetical protein Vretimale_16343, partial [Volvox reticuliferus]